MLPSGRPVQATNEATRNGSRLCFPTWPSTQPHGPRGDDPQPHQHPCARLQAPYRHQDDLVPMTPAVTLFLSVATPQAAGGCEFGRTLLKPAPPTPHRRKDPGGAGFPLPGC